MMRLKSYFAGTVESAICLARQEMGEEAMLVSSRKTLPESKHLGMYEVVFASAHDQARVSAAPRAPQAEQAPAAAPQNLVNEMAEMRRQLSRMSSLVARSAVRGGLRASSAPNAALDELDRLMTANEVDGDLACSILRAVETAGTGDHELRQAFRRDVQSRFRVSPELSPWSFETAAGPGSSSARRIVALVGPPGAGKTCALAKLAVRYGISARRSTHLISYDSHRIASGEQLRSYATILGVPFESFETVGALAQSLKENSRKELVLVDTPGYSAQDFELSSELANFLSTYPHVDVHLVLSCSTKSSDISRMVDRYNIFGPAKLLFTRLDETDSYGVILNESARAGLPVSFLGTGPRVPDDLEPASLDRITDLLLGGRESHAVANA